MQIITLDEFIADIETTFSSYADTKDIDRISVKTWVIESLRKFGKNICEKREDVVTVKNSRALLKEGFKSLVLAIKLEDTGELKKPREKTLIIERQKIENPAQWSDATMDYFANYCESTITTEKVYLYREPEDTYYEYNWLSLVKGMKKDSLDVNCLNAHPAIRNTYPNTISITNRTINTNFKEGKIYLQYNSLPSDDNGEVAIPIISTGHIKDYIENLVKIKLAENFIINQKNPQGIQSLLPMWKQDDRKLEIMARSEANWSGLPKNYSQKIYAQNRFNESLYNLPK